MREEVTREIHTLVMFPMIERTVEMNSFCCLCSRAAQQKDRRIMGFTEYYQNILLNPSIWELTNDLLLRRE
jgi:hypothetical protein